MSSHPLLETVSRLAHHAQFVWDSPDAERPMLVEHTDHQDTRYMRDGWELRVCSRRLYSEPITMRWFPRDTDPDSHQELRAEFSGLRSLNTKLVLTTYLQERMRCYALEFDLIMGTEQYWFYDECFSLRDRSGTPRPAEEMHYFIDELSLFHLPPFLQPEEPAQ